MLARLVSLLLVLVLLGPARPAVAQGDDISAAGRGVVRVVVAVVEDGEVADFGHGSGFAVAPNRVVTNAHVVALAAQLPEMAVIGVVPSGRDKARRARIVTVDPARDLALLEYEGGALPPLALYTGPLADGSPVTVLGYPGNVDLATASSMDDYIQPVPPTRSVGIFSNLRPIRGIQTLLHTANLARGHSGGPLLDGCGRVLGVNTLLTRAGEGDSPFAFAVANQELAAFLREARQPFQAVTSECVSMSERMRADAAQAEAERQAREAAAAARSAAERAGAMARIEDARDTRLYLAALVLALALVAFGGGGIMEIKNRRQPAMILGGTGAALVILSIAIFFTRPGRDAAEAPAPGPVSAAREPNRFVGRNSCTLVTDRSRVIAASATSVSLEWSEGGCVNGRTQYARNGEVWSRVLVPEGEQAVSVVSFRPASGEYVVNRYLLDGEAMGRVRGLRRGVDIKACTADAEARTILADQLREVSAALPRLPNERLVYRCTPERG